LQRAGVCITAPVMLTEIKRERAADNGQGLFFFLLFFSFLFCWLYMHISYIFISQYIWDRAATDPGIVSFTLVVKLRLGHRWEAQVGPPPSLSVIHMITCDLYVCSLGPPGLPRCSPGLPWCSPGFHWCSPGLHCVSWAPLCSLGSPGVSWRFLLVPIVFTGFPCAP
jgi:hypothetical protein